MEAVSEDSERVGGSAVEVAVLTLEANEENRSAEPVEEFYIHVRLRAGSFDVPRARYDRVRALVALHCRQQSR